MTFTLLLLLKYDFWVLSIISLTFKVAPPSHPLFHGGLHAAVSPPLKPTPFIRDDSVCACTHEGSHVLAYVFLMPVCVFVCVCYHSPPEYPLESLHGADTGCEKSGIECCPNATALICYLKRE